MKVSNMTSPRTGNPVANQFLIKLSDGAIFQSYETLIAVKYNDGRIKLAEGWGDYSRTTSKYLYQFLNMNRKEIQEAVKAGAITEGGLPA